MLEINARLTGETIARKILRDAAFDAVRPKLAYQCGEILARIPAGRWGQPQEVGGAAVTPVRAREVHGDEKNRLWAIADAGNPAYARYREAAEREIPILLLEPQS